MEIISYNVTSLANKPIRKNAVRMSRKAAVSRSFPRMLVRAVAIPAGVRFPGAMPSFRTALIRDVKARLRLAAQASARGFAQYRMLFCIVLAGVALGWALLAFDQYNRSFADSLNISRFSFLESPGLEQELIRFVLPQVDISDPLDALMAEAAETTAFVFAAPVSYSSYTVKSGDTISGITLQAGLKNMSTLIAVNDIDNARQLRAGQKLTVPSIDGILYLTQQGDSLAGLSVRYGIAMEDLLDTNDLQSSIIQPGQRLFIPGAQLDAAALRKAMGELFVYPLTVAWRLTSLVGYRKDPFGSGTTQYHNGIDMAAPSGSPIRAAMGGTVAASGYSSVYGNYVIINHGNGYQTMYGHMSKILVRQGQAVSQSTQIGLVGSTGLSTGPHLHFTVYKNGKVIDPRTVLK